MAGIGRWRAPVAAVDSAYQLRSKPLPPNQIGTYPLVHVLQNARQPDRSSEIAWFARAVSFRARSSDDADGGKR